MGNAEKDVSGKKEEQIMKVENKGMKGEKTHLKNSYIP